MKKIKFYLYSPKSAKWQSLVGQLVLFSYGWSVGSWSVGRLVSWYFLAMVGQLVLFIIGWSVGGWSVGGWSVGRLVSSPSIVNIESTTFSIHRYSTVKAEKVKQTFS